MMKKFFDAMIIISEKYFTIVLIVQFKVGCLIGLHWHPLETWRLDTIIKKDGIYILGMTKEGTKNQDGTQDELLCLIKSDKKSFSEEITYITRSVIALVVQ